MDEAERIAAELTSDERTWLTHGIQHFGFLYFVVAQDLRRKGLLDGFTVNDLGLRVCTILEKQHATN